MERLLDGGRTVLLETGGQIDVSRVPGAVVKVVDVKCPASGESEKVEWSNIDRLGSRDQVKFVIQNRADYEFARDIVTRHALDRRCAAVLFSPVHGVMNPKDLSEWILEDRMPVRLQLQIHKHIWGANARGV
jgi:7-carboxy-7-deazaguanine synthase